LEFVIRIGIFCFLRGRNGTFSKAESVAETVPNSFGAGEERVDRSAGRATQRGEGVAPGGSVREEVLPSRLRSTPNFLTGRATLVPEILKKRLRKLWRILKLFLKNFEWFFQSFVRFFSLIFGAGRRSRGFGFLRCCWLLAGGMFPGKIAIL
jgi:hypothetical protein